jgi:streptolysin S family bacteriocin protoxin
MPRRPVETLTEVKLRLKREQDEKRTQRKISELMLEEEPEREVQELVRQSRLLLQQVEEEKKVTVRVSLRCCCCTVCCVFCAVFVQCVGGSCGAAAHKRWQ